MPTNIVLFLFLSVGIPVITYFVKSFTLPAAIVASGMLLVIGFARMECLYLIVIAFCTIALIEKIAGGKFSRKRNTASQKHGTRTIVQLLANGGCATLFAILYLLTEYDAFIVAFVSTITEALCDSAASAIGTRVKGKCIDICSFEPLEPGLSGGVSFVGSLACVMCAVLMGALSLVFKTTTVASAAVIFVSGVLGCFFDSYLGASQQAKYRCIICGKLTDGTLHCGQKTQFFSGKKHINNNTVNFLSNTFSGFIALALFFLVNSSFGQMVLCYGFLLWVGLMCSEILHELGHVLGCLLSASKIHEVKVSFFLFDIANKKIRLSLTKKNFCLFHSKTKRQRLFSVVMGPIVNLVAAIVGIVLGKLFLSNFLVLFAICNLYKGIINLIPVGKRDGAIIKKTLKGREL